MVLTHIFVLHLAATLAMTGIIWSVQWVQYPLFARVRAADFREYHATHVRRIGHVVGPLMLVEAASGILLSLLPGALPSGALLLGLLLLAVAWASTFLFQVPLHRRLGTASGLDLRYRLIRSNWIRTFAWTARAALLLWILSSSVRVY